MCPICGSGNYEQEGDKDYLTLTCSQCGYVWTLESYHEEGEDKWREPESVPW